MKLTARRASWYMAALLVALVLPGASAYATAVNYIYVDWSAYTLSTRSGAGSATGTFTVGTQIINVNYTGDVASATQINNVGIDYYIPASVYTNSVVANVPTNVDIVTLAENPPYTDTLNFSSPLLNPILDIVSLGSPSIQVSYSFDATPIILSQGAGYWGGCNTCLSVNGNTLIGTEGSGVIEFLGSYNSISWTTTGGEYWNGFTVGVAGLGTLTPEPSTRTGFLLAAGFAALLVLIGKSARRGHYCRVAHSLVAEG
jgi:hypothetical protein